MTFRVTDAATSRILGNRIAAAKQQTQVAQERIFTGKRINRPSDDPVGAETALRLRSSQAAVAQFQRNTEAGEARLLASDSALNSYEQVLDRVRTLLVQTASDTFPSEVRSSLATEIDGLRAQVTGIVNQRTVDGYTFGGGRQSLPPFDTTTNVFTPDAFIATPQTIQIEPDTPPVKLGVVAPSTFSDASGTIFDMLATVASALRGTGDEVADKATLRSSLARVGVFEESASVARTIVGGNLKRVEIARERLTNDSLLLASALEKIEGADLAESAIAFREAQNSLEAILQTGAQTNRRSLLDFLG